MTKLLRRVESHFGGRADRAEGSFDLLYVNAEHAAVVDQSSRFTRLFHGTVPMNAEDHLADLAEIAGQEEYGSTGDEICGIYRLQAESAGNAEALNGRLRRRFEVSGTTRTPGRAS